MPDYNGIELAKHFKENFKDVFIIMVSSLNLEHIILESLRAGAVDYLHKPFTSDDLLSSVQKIEQELNREEG